MYSHFCNNARVVLLRYRKIRDIKAIDSIGTTLPTPHCNVQHLSSATQQPQMRDTGSLTDDKCSLLFNSVILTVYFESERGPFL
jgi:hypothetical protein